MPKRTFQPSNTKKERISMALESECLHLMDKRFFQGDDLREERGLQCLMKSTQVVFELQLRCCLSNTFFLFNSFENLLISND